MIACGYVIDSIMFSMRIACVKEFALCFDAPQAVEPREARETDALRPRRFPNITAERANCISAALQ